MAGIPTHSFGVATTIVVLGAATTIVVRVRVGHSETHRTPYFLASVHSIRPTKNTCSPHETFLQSPTKPLHETTLRSPTNSCAPSYDCEIPRPVPSHSVLSRFIPSCHVPSRPALPRSITSHHVTSYHVTSRHALSHSVPSCPFLSRPVTSQTKYVISCGGYLK
jgi:hypothetical protein